MTNETKNTSDTEEKATEIKTDQTKKRKNKKWIAGIAAAAVLTAAIAGGAYAYTKSQTVGSVNGDRITKSELYDTMANVYGASAVDSLVTMKVIEKEADERNIKVNDSEINKEVDAYIESYGGEDALKSALEASSLTLDDLKEDIAVNIKIEKLMQEDIEITEDEVKAYYEENKANYDQSEQVEVSHILVEDEDKAKELLKKIKDGEDFAELAKENSTDTASAENGGELGYISEGEMVEEFEKAAFALEVDEVSDVVKSEYGYHIIKATGHKEAKESTYEESKEDAKEAALSEKISSEYSTWLEDLKKDYKIKNKFE
ncbi:foldase [Pradoshia sp. D12]|uniref:peptidylprolyl isomerase n=1 Tax=Bacillaceae TaxID=186817 RepID=UPI0009811604|nr:MULTISPECIES: peptidylprolyl isomerase [Bacillaceae]QFK71517.1 foldase [Pradoshia sp. D12]TPF73312.1 foldase [Bacillus sp. D12]